MDIGSIVTISTDWFKGKFTGKPHISWENQWFPVDFPINQSIDLSSSSSSAAIPRANPHLGAKVLGSSILGRRVEGLDVSSSYWLVVDLPLWIMVSIWIIYG